MIFWEKQKLIAALYEKYTKPVREKYGLTQMQYDILMFLHNNPKYDTAADIVRIRQLTKSHVSAALKELESAGYLLGRYEPGNKKTRHLRLLERAKPVTEDGERVQQAFGHRLLQGFTEEEITVCREIFTRMCQNAAEGLNPSDTDGI